MDQSPKVTKILLMGDRGVGKTTLIRETLTDSFQVISLLRSEDRIRLLENPSHLRRMIDPKKNAIVIDEIQKIPDLLDEIQDLIEEKRIKFLLLQHLNKLIVMEYRTGVLLLKALFV